MFFDKANIPTITATIHLSWQHQLRCWLYDPLPFHSKCSTLSFRQVTIPKVVTKKIQTQHQGKRLKLPYWPKHLGAHCIQQGDLEKATQWGCYNLQQWPPPCCGSQALPLKGTGPKPHQKPLCPKICGSRIGLFAYQGRHKDIVGGQS